ncbi:MAG: 30S ribosomal protein S20 [Gammaproteobacteria bacterium]|nr:30S ribosomal protein S20 [Gammaproteobacteria bacterium]MCP5137446.1 30S ribosomal protein S20 [Gammaproteobacteria bacterium]
MANSAQARKRARQNEKNRQHNASRRSMMRTAMKKVLNAAAAGDKETATAAYQNASSLLDRAAKIGLLHKNAASRQKSRLNRHIHAMG